MVQNQGQPARILVVDDDASVRRVLECMLARLGHDAIGVDSGFRALERFAAEAGAFDLVILDLRMPGMDGLTCFRALRERYPDVRALFVSGYEPDADTVDALRAYRAQIVKKPFDLAQLQTLVHDALAETVARS